MIAYIIRASVLFIAIFALYIFIKKPTSLTFRDVLSCIWWVYLITLLVLVFESDIKISEMGDYFRRRLETGEDINLVPFRTIVNYIRYAGWDDMMVNITGNIVMFIPFGMGLVYLTNRGASVKKNLIYCLIFPLFIELVQLFIGRYVDVDDIILNFTGSALGVCVSCLMARIFPYFKKLADK